MKKLHGPPILLGLLALALVLGPAAAAEKVTFHGGNSLLVQRALVQGDLVVLHLLDGGTIKLPHTAIQSMEHMDRRAAMEEWKRERRGETVRSGGSERTAANIGWQEKMTLLASGSPPVDTGTEPEPQLLRQRRFSSSPVPSITPYGARAPTDLDVLPPGQTRDIYNVPLTMHTRSDAGGGSAAERPDPGEGSRAITDPRVRQFYKDGGERQAGGRRKAWDRSAYGAQ
jgi:hypothetical protein